MTTDHLSEIRCRFLERRLMKRANAWRALLQLPDDNGFTAALLSRMVNWQVRATIEGDSTVEIHPAAIVDVPPKGKGFLVAIENVYEADTPNLGPKLTLLCGQSVKLTVEPAEQPEDPVRGTVSRDALKGLHATFFGHPRFQAFLSEKTGEPVSDFDSCKAVFKRHMGVESCAELDQEPVAALIAAFNTWLGGGDDVRRGGMRRGGL